MEYVKVHLFWHELNSFVIDHDNNHIDKNFELDELRMLCVKSFIANGYEVNLWSYQNIINELDHFNFVKRNAKDIISIEEFCSHKISLIKPKRKEKLDTLHIAHFTDYFRAMVIYKEGGWWFDMDTYCMKRLPIPDEKDNGVIFGSTLVKGTGKYAEKKYLMNKTFEERKSGIWKFKTYGQFVNGIMYGEKNHPLMLKIALKVKESFYDNVNGFITPMLRSYDVVDCKSYHNSIRPPIAFAPLPFWKTKYYLMEHEKSKERYSFGSHIPSLKEIYSHSYCVNFFNQSFQYISHHKNTISKEIISYLCDKLCIKINFYQIKKDKFDGNYHIIKRGTKRNIDKDDIEIDNIVTKKVCL